MERKKRILQPNYSQISEPFSGSPFMFVLYFMKKYPWLSLAMAVSEILAKTLIVMLPFILKHIITLLGQYNQDPHAAFESGELGVLVWQFIGVAAAIEFFKRCSGMIDYFLSTALTSYVRVEMFSYIQNHSHAFFMNRFAGSIGNKIVQTSSAVRDVCYRVFRDFLPLLTAFALTAATALTVSVTVSCIFAVWMAVFIGFTVYRAPKIVKRAKQYSDDKSSFTGMVVDVLSNHTVVRSFSAHNHEFDNASQRANVLNYSGRRTIKTVEWTRAVQSVLTLSLVAFILLYCIAAWRQGLIVYADMVFLLPVTVTLTALANDVASRMVEFFEQYGTVEEGLEFMIHPYDIKDRPDAKALVVEGGAEIQIDRLSFTYNTRVTVFHELSFTVPPGQKVGLVGASGAGKTSLVALLLRFYDPDSGAILINGQDIKAVTQKTLRDHIAYIPQDTSLFHRTLLENIAYAKPGATREEVIEAAKQAHAHDFICALEGGYDTIVGERGLKLSGGQRQRIAIARAILKDAPILILDEATSALDSESEYLIQESLKKLMQGKTVIAIAHRLSTIAHLDRLLVLDRGEIVEDGRHAELIQNPQGIYAKLWSMQSGGFLG